MPLVQGGFGSSSEGRGEKSGNIAEHRGETFSHCHSREGHTHTLSLNRSSACFRPSSGIVLNSSPEQRSAQSEERSPVQYT